MNDVAVGIEQLNCHGAEPRFTFILSTVSVFVMENESTDRPSPSVCEVEYGCLIRRDIRIDQIRRETCVAREIGLLDSVPPNRNTAELISSIEARLRRPDRISVVIPLSDRHAANSRLVIIARTIAVEVVKDRAADTGRSTDWQT